MDAAALSARAGPRRPQAGARPRWMRAAKPASTPAPLPKPRWGHGVDRDPEARRPLRAPAATLVQAEVTMLPFSGDTFDFSLAVTQLCFVSDPCSAVAELVRVTPPGGREWYWPNSAA